MSIGVFGYCSKHLNDQVLRSFGRHELSPSHMFGSFGELSRLSCFVPNSKSPQRPQNPSLLHNVRGDPKNHLTPLLLLIVWYCSFLSQYSERTFQSTSHELETKSACLTNVANITCKSGGPRLHWQFPGFVWKVGLRSLQPPKAFGNVQSDGALQAA